MGQQVAFNKDIHITAEVWEDDNGDYYVTNIEDNHLKLIRTVYYPIGNRMYYPKKWGKKKGTLTLLEYLIDSDERILAKTIERLEKLKKCKSTVETEWNDKGKKIR
jgi:hypothetical protein